MKKFKVNRKSIKILSWLIFIVYIVMLLKIILFKYPSHMLLNVLKENDLEGLMRRIQYTSNYIPFKNIFFIFSSQENIRHIVRNVIGNIIIFIPLGILLPILIEKAKKIRTILVVSLGISLLFEIIQLLTGIGDFDVDDLILNISGGLIGLLLYNILNKYVIDDRK